MSIASYRETLTENKIAFTEKEPMSAHTTFRIGGAADIYAVPMTEGELILAVSAAKACGVRFTVLGRGSNVVFDDGGYGGVVISTEKLNSINISGCEITCQCGASFTALAAIARDAGLSGLEFAYGIPGAAGGAVVMNAGAYGGEVSAVLINSTYYDAETGDICTIDLQEHCFGYRQSVYKSHPERIILSATFSLKERSIEDIRCEMNKYMESRKSKQPLEYPSAGSVFKRAPGHYTGQMIEELGLKGYTVGGAQISEKHAGFIVNRGGATSADVSELVSFIKEKVYAGYGVRLEEELIFIK